MAVLHRGSRGEQTKELQAALKAAGYDPGPIDGIFGPLTEAAVRAYQQGSDLRIDGIAGSETLNSLGLVSSPSPSASTPSGGTDYTDAPETRFNGLPGEPELWEDSGTGERFAVYEIPGTEPPVPLLFAVERDADWRSFFGDKTPQADRVLATEEILSTGAIKFGTSDNIPEKDGDPWAGFMDRMNRAMEVQPWLADPEVFALFSGAWLEGRPLETWELQTTDYWQGLNDAQRSWMSLAAGDPAEAQRFTDDIQIDVFNSFRDLGVEPPVEVVEYMTTKAAHGDWSAPYLQEQIYNVSGVPSEGATGLDTGLSTFLKSEGLSVAGATLGISDVESMFRTWLGPAFAPTQDQVATWSDRFRRNGQVARDELTQMLQGQRMALFPEYSDENRTYEDIAGPWRNYVNQVWGQLPDETDPMFTQILRLNDATEAGKLLRSEGMKRNIGAVTDDALGGLMSNTSTVRRPV